MSSGPFFFALVDSTETTFVLAHEREDLLIYSATRELAEGEKPTLTIEVRNPRRGLLATGAKIWAWFAWRDSDGHVIPLFFGRLIAYPTDMIGEVVTLVFVAEPLDYLAQKQAVAETLKVRPFYDPIFLTPPQRDDPDAILEGYTLRYHVDPVTHVVSVSDILAGEDVLDEFQESDAYYDSVKTSLEQAPLAAINVDLTVAWTQSAIGTIDFGPFTWFTYTGASTIADWPKPLQSLGGGWSCAVGSAYDIYGISTAIMFATNYQWQNHEKKHEDGDTMSVSESASVPTTPAPMIRQTLTSFSQSASIDPEDPDAVDIPTSQASSTVLMIPQWRVDTEFAAAYEAKRPRTERVVFTLTANLQPILSNPQSPPLPVQETLSLSGTDVGQPLETVLDWLSVKGRHVDLYTVMYPDNPTVPGGTSFQIATRSGTAGVIEPEFSPIIGGTTLDGGVIWTSMGDSLPTSADDWTPSTLVEVGDLIRPLPFLWAPWGALVPPPRLYGSSIGPGQVCRASNGSYQVCNLGGLTGLAEPPFSAAWGAHTTDNEVDWVCIGNSVPTGVDFFLCVGAGTTGLFEPEFGNPFSLSDNGVVWIGVGTAGSFLSVPIGDLAKRSYFTQDRGLWSLEHGICRGRAKLLQRARAVQLSWECRFERAIGLTCRKNGLLHDPRLPGGQAQGKIIAAKLSVVGDTGLQIGAVTVGCAVGFGGSVTALPGTGVYAAPGYMQPGYQQMLGNLVPLPGGDVGYSTPTGEPSDDGLVFPLTRNNAVAVDAVRGSLDRQIAAIDGVLPLIVLAAHLQDTPGGASLNQQLEIANLSRFTVETALAGEGLWWDLQLKPVVNGPFHTERQVITTPLEAPPQINLAAPSL